MLLEKNIRLLADFDRSLYERVKCCLKAEQLQSSFNLCQARNQELTIKYNDGVKEKYLISSFDPSAEGAKWAKSQKDGEIYLVYGFGLGYHLHHFERESVHKVLVIEPSMDIFLLALEATDLEWIFKSKKIQLSVAENDEKLFSSISNIIRFSFGKRVELAVYPSYLRIYADEYCKLEKNIGRIINNSIISKNTYNFFGKLWTDNFFKNLYMSLKAHKVIGLFNKFLNIPVIIISAGPSLTKNVHLLKELKGKALLLCVATAYPTLKKYGVQPDFITSYDGGVENYLQFKKLEIKDVPLIFGSEINFQILKEYQGKIVAANINSPFLSWMEKQLDFTTGNLLVGPSIANVTFDLARKLGGNPIVFVGQDLAFTDNKTHATGTIYENRRFKYTGSVGQVFVEDIFGKEVLSSRSLVSFLHWFERQIENTKDRIIIDATEGGAKIKATKIMNLREVIDKYCTTEFEIDNIVNKFFENYVEPDQHFYQNVLMNLEKITDDLLEVKNKSFQGLNCLDKLSNLYKNPRQNDWKIKRILQQLNDIDQILLKPSDGRIFLQYIFQPLLLPIINSPESRAKPQETEKEQQKRIIKYSKNLYLGIRDISELVLEMIEKAKSDFV